MAEELTRPNEDLANVSSSAERRRIQNRIAQRAYRRSVKERKNEVQRLKERICELESTLRDGTNGSKVVDVPLLNSPDALGGSTQLPSTPNLESIASPENPLEHDENMDQSPERGDITALQPFFKSKFDQVLDVPAESSTFVCTKSALKLLCPETSIMLALESQPDLSTIRSSADHLSLKSGTNSFLMPPFPNESHQEAIQEDESSKALGEDELGLAGHAIQYDARQLQMTCTFNSDNQWPGVLSPSVYSVNAVQIPSPPFLRSDYGEQKSPTSHSHTRLLHLAVASGNAKTVSLLLQNVEMPINAKDDAGFTPFERAVLSGRTDMVAVLLDHGIDFERHSETP